MGDVYTFIWRSFSVWFLCCILYTVCAFASPCGSRIQCYGDLPELAADSCCPLMPGDSCGNDTERECDEEFGYTCTDGACKGEHNLTFSDVTETTVILSWNAFLPDGSKYEYNVLHATSYTKQPTKWNVTGVGNQTSYILARLIPATRYFVRLGIWMPHKYTNLTEVVVFVTKAKDCFYSGRRVPVNERLLVGCEESCLCRPTGKFDCVGVCRAENNELPTCEQGMSFKGCCDEIPECVRNNCTYLGKQFLHEEMWNIDCEENCTCFNGVVMCNPLCERLARPENCSNARLVKSEDGCCDTWACDDEGEMCEFRNTTYRPGVWFPLGTCEMCYCSPVTLETECILLGHCGTVTVPAASVVCPSPMVLKNVCCDEVVCQKDAGFGVLMDYYTVTKYTVTSLLVRFRFNSSIDNVIVLGISFFYTTNPTNESYASWTNITFNMKDILRLDNSSLNFKEFGKSRRLYCLGDSFMFVVSNLKVDEFYYSKLGIYIGGMTTEMEAEGDTTQTREHYISDTVASKYEGFMTSYPDHIRDGVDHVIFSASNITSSTALLSWSIPISYQINITSFVIKYKSFSGRSWLYTEHLIFSDSFYQLTCLFNMRWYEVQLLAYPAESVLSTTFFNTTDVTETLDPRFITQIKDVLIGHTYAVIQWNPLTPAVLESVSNFEIQWSTGDSDDLQWKFCVRPDSNSYTIDNLAPGTQFLAWVGTNLRSSKTVYSNRIHFVTTSYASPQHSSTSHSIIAAITISCVSVFAMIGAIITVMYVTRCRRRMAYETSTSFENKIFQIYSQRDDPDA